MKKYGIKLWSTDANKNPELVKVSAKAVKEGFFDFIELFAVPESFDSTYKLFYDELKEHEITIHASHSFFGFDTGDKNKLNENIKQFSAAQKFADLFSSNIIITHTGIGNKKENLEETVRQFNIINDKRIAVENMPSYCSKTYVKLHGTSPDEIKYIIDNVGCSFCLDFSHAICAANNAKKDIFEVLKNFSKLNPNIYHICDGITKDDFDAHMHFGDGDYPLEKLIQYINPNSHITMETGGEPNGINLWIKDIKYLKSI